MTDQGTDNRYQAWLSYRCKNERHIAARDKLEALCKDQGIQLIYDEKETGEGDDLFEFMRKLSASRIIFVFLDKDYLASPYTAHELIRISEIDCFDQRVIRLLRMDDSIVATRATELLDQWRSSSWIGELERQISKKGSDSLPSRMKQAWDKLVYPLLDIKNTPLIGGKKDDILRDLVSGVAKEQKDFVKQEDGNLKQFLIDAIARIIANSSTLLPGVFSRDHKLDLSPNLGAKAVARALLDTATVREAVAVVTRVAGERKKSLGKDSTEWRECFVDAEDVCGWLLLSSVNPDWWYHNELRLFPTRPSQVAHEVPLETPAYIEVVISRSFKVTAKYQRDEVGKARPLYAGDQDHLLFDALSDGATDTSLLAEIYNDLWQVDSGSLKEKKPQDLIKDIVDAAKARFEDTGKPVYYLMLQDKIRLLKQRPWFKGLEADLAGQVRFICCDVEAKESDIPASREPQSTLLAQLSRFLALEN